MINKKLAEERNLSVDVILNIEMIHKERYCLHKLMMNCQEKELANLDKDCDDIEYRLQDLWGFTRDSAYFKRWYRPRCTCPKMDNNDRYPTEHYITTMDCPLHGAARDNSF